LKFKELPEYQKMNSK